MNCSSEYSCLLLSVYLPCDNYTNTVSVEYIERFDYIKQLFNPTTCLFVAEILILRSKDIRLNYMYV